MDMSTTELGIICTFFALMSLIRNHAKPKSADEIKNVRRLVRSEIAKLDIESRLMLLDEIGKLNPNGYLDDQEQATVKR